MVVYGSHREAYLKGLFDTVYGADIVERFAIENPFALDQLVKELASAVGSLTNPSKLANTLNTVAHAGATDKTVKRYLDALTDAFIFSEAERFDVKGKRYFDYPMKYYATDVGIRNALLNFRQIEETHLMENVIYNELVLRGYAVDVGAIRVTETREGKRGGQGDTPDAADGGGGGSEARCERECGGRGVGHEFSSRSRVGNRGVSSAPV